MFLTSILLAKPKAKSVLVVVESVISGHRRLLARARLDEKFEFIKFDPFIQQEALYREVKKVKSLRTRTGS